MRTLHVAALAVLSLSACKSSSTTVSGDEAKDLLVERNWMDRMPETDRDHLFVYRFVPSMGGGVFQDRTLYKGTFELFQFEHTAAEIKFNLLETGDVVTSPYRIEQVDGPEPFDLKLTISEDPRGPKAYFGMRSETDLDGMRLEQRLRALR